MPPPNNDASDTVARVLAELGTDFTPEIEAPAAEAEPCEIHLKPLKEILAHAKTRGLQTRIMVLDIDETLLTLDREAWSFSLKCPQAWENRMQTERENDRANGTLTIWTLGTFRTYVGGIYELSPTGDQEIRLEIQLVLDTFEEYINPHLVIATGEDGMDGRPGCKVRHILEWYYAQGIPKEHIHMFDDQDENVIRRAIEAGYRATLIPLEASAAHRIIAGDRSRTSMNPYAFCRSNTPPPAAGDMTSNPGHSIGSALAKSAFKPLNNSI